MNVSAATLESLVEEIFSAAGCNRGEAQAIARRLVDSNLVGHDSHGVIRVPDYIAWLQAGKVVANQSVTTVVDAGALAILDGQFGFGQVVGQEAMELAIQRARELGVAVVGLRNAGHLGRIGDWAELATQAGLVSLHFVNTSGGGILVAPFGGTERRLSANPIAAGVPRSAGPPLILDMSTCVIAEGKIKVARNKGAQLPPDCVLDAQGQPTTDPPAFYGPPMGAILPLGGHKGYGLSVIVEVLAGALSAASCSNPSATRVANNMLSIVLDPLKIQPVEAFESELERFIAYVKSARTVAPGGEILMPGELEARTRADRLERGIELDAATWNNLLQVGNQLGVAA